MPVARDHRQRALRHQRIEGAVARQELTLTITPPDGEPRRVPISSRSDTPIEVEYYQHGGILDYVLRELVA